MRSSLVPFAVLALTTAAWAAEPAPAFPAFDLDAYCNAQARYSYAATLGDSNFVGVLQTCLDRESDAKVSASARWPRVGPRLAADCITLADGKYSWLSRCLDQGDRLSRR